jgi:hypothetical protein
MLDRGTRLRLTWSSTTGDDATDTMWCGHETRLPRTHLLEALEKHFLARATWCDGVRAAALVGEQLL